MRRVVGGVGGAWSVASPSLFAVCTDDLLPATAHRRADARPHLGMHNLEQRTHVR